MRSSVAAVLVIAITSGACLYDFQRDYENCMAFGRCAPVSDAGVDDAGVDAGRPDAGGGGDAGVDAGYSWTLVHTLPGHPRLWGLAAIAPGHVIVVGAYAGGGRGPIAEYSNGQWVENAYSVYVSPYPAAAANEDLTCILGEFGSARSHTFPNGTWDGGVMGAGYNHGADYYALWTAGTSFWIGGLYGNVARLAGSVWEDAGTLLSGSEIIDGWASSETNQYVVTANRELVRYDGGAWSLITTRSLFTASIWGVSTDELWGAGQDVFRYRQGSFETLDAGRETWNGLWGSGPSDVFIVGANGVVARWNGSSFERKQISPYHLASVHGTGPADVWATDIDGGIYHYGP